MHSHLKLLMVLGLSVTVRVRARDGEWIFPLFFFLLKVTNTFVLSSWPRLVLVSRASRIFLYFRWEERGLAPTGNKEKYGWLMRLD